MSLPGTVGHFLENSIEMGSEIVASLHGDWYTLDRQMTDKQTDHTSFLE